VAAVPYISVDVPVCLDLSCHVVFPCPCVPQVLVASPVTVGVSEHHMEVGPGTLTSRPEIVRHRPPPHA
jgi:hypothetical protein